MSEKGAKPRYLTPEEAQATLDELEKTPYVRRMVAFGLQTGFDRKDMMELKWGERVKGDAQVIVKRRAQIRAGIGDSRKRGLKCIRHMFAGWQVSICKTDIFVLKDLMGHSDISTTHIYAHLIDSTRANEAMTAIGNVMSTKPKAERGKSKVIPFRASN